MEEKMKHLEMIQNVITRMASNSFLLRGWTVTLVVGLLAFANIKEMNIDFMFLALIPILFFWVLDAYYLNEERKYVKLYEHVAMLNSNQIDFSLNARQYESETGGIPSAFLSTTLGLFYAPTLIVVFVVIAIFR
ncbi:hypothetical protein [Cytobacillus firmus]|uniref:hypothetical protein n=1 Tax=Cytobacillus firmus TaxID=1399 RepID=UPI0018CE510E|nr:hypothetical protein [Cytobacillus firmus]MBG9546948.1 hypothetical protein [Cytobacillus firmus]MBG9601057.1 hypothetical protein [Cytobacillus firmus]MED1941894.1 hypothetical protein [Cytobacillus firmus]